MLIYNVTYKVDINVHLQWLQWMKKVHIPEAMHTGKFLDYRICRLMGVDEAEGISYVLQYRCADRKTFDLFQSENAYELQKTMHLRYGEQLVYFQTVMQEV